MKFTNLYLPSLYTLRNIARANRIILLIRAGRGVLFTQHTSSLSLFSVLAKDVSDARYIQRVLNIFKAKVPGSPVRAYAVPVQFLRNLSVFSSTSLPNPSLARSRAEVREGERSRSAAQSESRIIDPGTRAGMNHGGLQTRKASRRLPRPSRNTTSRPACSTPRFIIRRYCWPYVSRRGRNT